jgi:hypothetical protein
MLTFSASSQRITSRKVVRLARVGGAAAVAEGLPMEARTEHRSPRSMTQGVITAW